MNQLGKALIFLINLAIVLAVSFFVIGVMMDISSNETIRGISGIITFFFMLWFMFGRRKRYKQESESEIVTKDEHVNKMPWWQDEDRPYRFIFTHSEEALDAIESVVANHPKVERVFQDSGYWYSNGETGPEWHSMHVICDRKDSDEIQEFVKDQLNQRGLEGNYVEFMGSNN